MSTEILNCDIILNCDLCQHIMEKFTVEWERRIATNPFRPYTGMYEKIIDPLSECSSYAKWFKFWLDFEDLIDNHRPLMYTAADKLDEMYIIPNINELPGHELCNAPIALYDLALFSNCFRQELWCESKGLDLVRLGDLHKALHIRKEKKECHSDDSDSDDSD